jgi:hypothetical protein
MKAEIEPVVIPDVIQRGEQHDAPAHDNARGRQDAVSDGAGDGTRTRDHLLGRQMLYQLSYSRSSASL